MLFYGREGSRTSTILSAATSRSSSVCPLGQRISMRAADPSAPNPKRTSGSLDEAVFAHLEHINTFRVRPLTVGA